MQALTPEVKLHLIITGWEVEISDCYAYSFHEMKLNASGSLQYAKSKGFISKIIWRLSFRFERLSLLPIKAYSPWKAT
jgi:hypothetical protein